MANDAYNDDDSNNSNSSSSNDVCKIYDADDSFTLFVQLLLALFALWSLYWKRNHEHPKRRFDIWAFDVSKQAIGAGYAHVLNMMIAGIISVQNNLDDQCAWYGMSYLIDTTLGLVLAIFGLKLLQRFANAFSIASLQHSGVYVGNTALYHWTMQVLAWLTILSVCKVIIYLFMWLCQAPLGWLGTTLFKIFLGYKRLELLFVMILFPGVLNVVYFWIADNFLKAGDNETAAHVPDEDDDKATQLMEKGGKDHDTNDETELTATTASGWVAPWSIFGGSSDRRTNADQVATADAKHTTTLPSLI